MTRVVLAAAIGALVLAAAAGTAGRETAVAAPQLASAKGPVVFVPLGRFPRGDAVKLARFVRARAGLRTRVAGSKAMPRSMFDRARKQYRAQQLITLLSRPATSQDVVIGLTAEDMYSTSEPFRFVFSLRDPDGFAVVSRARMDPRAMGLAADPGLRLRRLQKMVLKNVGSLALGRPLNGNPRSVMFSVILSVDDLDYMTVDARPPAPSAARRAWLAKSNSVCASGTAREKDLLARARLDDQVGALEYAHSYVELRERQREELAAVKPAREDRAAFRALLTRFGMSIRTDRQGLAKLEANWNEAAVREWATGRVRAGFALKASALELGSRACGRYFDPVTYSS